jgi:hypothetical protein
MPVQFGQTVAASWEHIVGSKPEDQIFDEYPLLDLMSKGKAFMSVNGGRTINGPIEYAINTTFKSYSDTEELDTTRIDVFDEYQYQWKEYAGTVVMSELEKAKNQGEGRKFDLLAAKLENLRNSARKAVNEGLFSDGTGNSSKDIAGLAHIISSSPSSGTVGGINRGTYSWWRNQHIADGGTAYNALRSNMRILYNDCSSGFNSKHPDWALTSQTIGEAYEGLLIANERITGKTKADANASFKNEYFMFKDIPIMVDEDCGSDDLYMGNNANLKLAYQKGYWMKGFPSVDPANQTVEIFKVMTICNMVSNNPRRLGRLSSIA